MDGGIKWVQKKKKVVLNEGNWCLDLWGVNIFFFSFFDFYLRIWQTSSKSEEILFRRLLEFMFWLQTSFFFGLCFNISVSCVVYIFLFTMGVKKNFIKIKIIVNWIDWIKMLYPVVICKCLHFAKSFAKDFYRVNKFWALTSMTLSNV